MIPVRVTLDCGCVKATGRVVGWLSCPAHGRQRVAGFMESRDPLYGRHLERRARFVAMHGVREIPEG